MLKLCRKCDKDFVVGSFIPEIENILCKNCIISIEKNVLRYN